MASKKLSAQITIGGAITGALRSALTTTKDKIGEIGGAIGAVEKRQRELNRVIAEQYKLGAAANQLKIQYSTRELSDTEKQIAAMRRKQELMKREMAFNQNMHDLRGKLGTAGAVMGAGAIGAGMLLRNPLRAYMELDAAMNNMQVAMMDSTGKMPAQFEAIKRQTVELGAILPGTTADFVNLATALKEQGTPMQVIVNGALKSAAHLAVVMKMAPDQAGEMVAKLREAFQLQENEFERMADFTQRTKFGFGLKPDDLLLGAKYYGGKLNQLGITGAENVRKIYAIQGMAAQQGMDGSTFGTNFSMMLTRVGLLTERMHKNSKEMRAANAVLDKYKIKLEFFDKKGKFAGVENMVAQLDKLKVLTQEERLQVGTRYFGEEGGRPADLIARNGMDGYKKALQTLDAEATLNQRIEKSLESFKNQLESLQGNITNFLAAVGEPIAKLFTPVMKTISEIVGGPMQRWVEQNQKLVGIVGGLVAAGGVLLAIGSAIAVIGVAAAAVAASGPGWVALGGVMTAIGATLTGPILLGLGLVLAASIALYTHWQIVEPFLVGIWEGFADGMQPVIPLLQTIGKIVGEIAGFFGLLGNQVDYSATSMEKARSVGMMLGSALAGAFRMAMIPVRTLGTFIGLAASNIGLLFDAVGKLKAGDFKGALGNIGSILSNSMDAVKDPTTYGFSPSAPAPPAPAGRGGSPIITDNSKTEIKLVQQPGESNADLSKRLMEDMERMRRIRQRSTMADQVSP